MNQLLKIIFLAPAVLLGTPVMAQAPSGGGKTFQYRFYAGAIDGKYSESEKSDVLGADGTTGGVKMKGTEIDVGYVYQGFELGLDLRSLTPQGVDWWSKRQDLTLSLAYLWEKYPWVEPLVGYWQSSQSGAGSDAVTAPPPAFISKNKAFVFGLKSNVIPYYFGEHGVLVQAHINYVTTLAASRNFGTESDIALGYIYNFGRLKLGLAIGQWRQFFNAAKSDPDDSSQSISVRSTYIARHYGLYVQY